MEVAMEHLLTNKTVSLTELRDPAKVLEKAGSSPVAVLNRNKVVGYFVPAQAVEGITTSYISTEEGLAIFEKRKAFLQPALDYLKGK
jgi:antitoxin StbD